MAWSKPSKFLLSKQRIPKRDDVRTFLREIPEELVYEQDKLYTITVPS